MTKMHIPKEVAGIRIPRKLRKAIARLPQEAGALMAAALASALVAGMWAGLRGLDRSR